MRPIANGDRAHFLGGIYRRLARIFGDLPPRVTPTVAAVGNGGSGAWRLFRGAIAVVKANAQEHVVDKAKKVFPAVENS